MVGRARLHDRADEYLRQTASDRVQHDGQQDADKRIGQAEGQDAETYQSDTSHNVCRNDAGAVADAVYEAGTRQVNQQLDAEIHGHQCCQAGQRDAPRALEGEQQEGDKVIHDRLGDITQVAGIQRMPV